jgi:hypothetical protein
LIGGGKRELALELFLFGDACDQAGILHDERKL